MNNKIILYMSISIIVLVYVFHQRLSGSTLHQRLSNISIYNYLDTTKQGEKVNGEPTSGNTQQHIDINEKILKNPYYKKYGLIPAQSKKQVTLLVIISTAPRRYDRRQAIRETWWTQCKQTQNVVPECIFMTDQQKPGDKNYKITRNESNTYGDLFFQDLSGGMQFHKRMIYHMIYALLNYDFDYYLRTDDDYFLCFENILQELPIPMIPDFHWGWVHPPPTRPEESCSLFSRDVVEQFILQDPQTMKCHPFGGQLLSVWSEGINKSRLFHHDQRLHHVPPVNEDLRKNSEVCHKYIGIHGAYPNDMRLFWKHRGRAFPSLSNLLDNSKVRVCDFPYNWRAMGALWRYEPKLCIDDPVWDMSGHVMFDGAYSGRQDVNKKKKT